MPYSGTQGENGSVGEYVRKAEHDFTSGTTQVSKYVTFQPWEDINRIYAYLDSKHISGATDSQGREKPFFNVCLSVRNIWYRATDIDRKNIKLRSTKQADDVKVFLGEVVLQDWMRREQFGTFLNAWGISLANFNEAVVKFVEQGGRLISSVVPWSRMICDVVDFADNPKVEVLEYTEAQLRNEKRYDQDMVDALCNAREARELTDDQKKDSKGDYVKCYEVHGVFPLSWLTDDEDDEEEYVQQMHVVSFVAGKEEGAWDDYTLFRGREARDPYLLTALIPEVDGSIALKGAVKTLFDAQWMQNHTVKTVKDQLDLASKLLFQTADETFLGQNVLTDLEQGDVLIHKDGSPLTAIYNRPDTNALTTFQEQWKKLGAEIAGVSETMLGVQPPSGTAWRQVNALLQESHSLFELMTENKGLAIEEMCRRFIFPFIRKQLNSADEVAAVFESTEVERLDERYVKNYATRRSNNAVKELVLRGQPVTPAQQAEFTAHYEREARANLPEGMQRYFTPSELGDETWRELFEDFAWVPEVDVTNENLDENAAVTLQAVLTFLVNKQGQPMTAEEKLVFNKLLQLTGAVSPLEIEGSERTVPQEAPVPAQPQPPAAVVPPPNAAQ